MKKKVLIIGSTGILGYAFNQIKILGIGSNYEFLFPRIDKFDLSNIESIKNYLQNFNPTYIVNCAALSGSMFYTSSNQMLTLEANITQNLNLLKAISDLSSNRPKKVCFIGSTSVYGDSLDYPSQYQSLITEEMYNLNDLTKGNYGYSVAKAILPCLAKTASLEMDLPCITLVPSGICGFSPFVDRTQTSRPKHTFLIGIILKLIESLRSGVNSLELPGSGKELRQFDYSLDLARVILWALDFYEDITPLNIVNFSQCSIESYTYIILQTLGLENDFVNFKHRNEPPNAISRPIVSNKRLLDLYSSFKYTDVKEYLPKVVKKYQEIYERD